MRATVCWGSIRNRDCILYPGAGTVVLIRPAQTFYERIKAWTGDSLVLFLEFRALWVENPQWWECTFWSSKINYWSTYWNASTLSRDGCYELVQSRLICEADEVIGQGWLRDWEDLEVWKRGFPSFAAFAVFRAGLPEGEDWKAYLSSWLRYGSPIENGPWDANNGYRAGGYDAVLFSTLTVDRSVERTIPRIAIPTGGRCGLPCRIGMTPQNGTTASDGPTLGWRRSIRTCPTGHRT